MTAAERRQLRKLAAKVRARDDLGLEEMRYADYYTHTAQHRGLGFTAQRGPSFWATEVERIVTADEAGLTPAQIEEQRPKAAGGAV